MNSKRGKRPDGAIADADRTDQSPDARRVRQFIRKAFERGVGSLDLFTCHPNGQDEGSKLGTHLKSRVEPHLSDEALISGLEGREFSFAVGMIDKSRQNPINRLGGRHEAGDQAMEAYWTIAGRALMLMASINSGPEMGAYITRISPTSDEGVMVVGGIRRKEDVRTQFRECLIAARETVNLRDYVYTMEVPYRSGSERFELDLESFTRILRHPEMVVSSDFTMSGPALLSPDARSGFIQEELRKLENREVMFYDLLPNCFNANGGMAEVRTPFKNMLPISGNERAKHGAIVEVKLGMVPADADALLQFTKDDWDGRNGRGTGKGYSEIFSRMIGMRGFNTFLGKARANGILTPIAQAMGDLEKSAGVSVVPLAGSYLQYWVDMAPEGSTAELVRRCVERRIHAKKQDDSHINVDLAPIVSILDAAHLDLSEVRSRFILKALGKDLYPMQVLDRTDFLLSFMENVHEAVQQRIFDSLARKENGGTPIRLRDLDNMKMVGWICSHRRTIRDTEDLIWAMRADETLPQDIKTKRAELEDWFFDFSWERFESIYYLLAKRVNQERNRSSIIPPPYTK